MDAFEESYRPLAASAVASGALALGVLGFTGEVWSALSPDAQAMVAAASRGAFLTFILIAALGALSFFVRARTGPNLVALVNLFASALFLAGVFVCGLVISRALSIDLPDADPPEPIAVLLAAGVVGSAVLALALVLVGLFGGRRKARNEAEETGA